MKAARYKKVIGLALGEHGLLAAEVVAGLKPQVRMLAEMPYPEGITPAQPAELGKALGQFLREKGFSAKSAIVGLPVKWVVVKPKEVPPSDNATMINMLRLEAEAEFSSELKDLVFDFVGDTASPVGAGQVNKTVLLLATPHKYIEAAQAICEGAKLNAVAVLPSALALGEVTAAVLDRDLVVLAVGQGGAELSVQQGLAMNSIRHLRSPMPQSPFVSELRRAVSTFMPTTGDRELILWGGSEGVDAKSLGDQLGFRVRAGELSDNLGVDTSVVGSNGDGSRYASAVALGSAAVTGRLAVDFLHSRLAPPKAKRIPPWAYAAALLLMCIVAGIVYGYKVIGKMQADLAAKTAKNDQMKGDVTNAVEFNARVDFARLWHNDDPRFLACLKGLTNANPIDNQLYATGITLKQVTAPTGNTTLSGRSAKKINLSALKSCQFIGRAPDAVYAHAFVANLQKTPGFSNVQLSSVAMAPAQRGMRGGVTVTVDFDYENPAPVATSVATAKPPAKPPTSQPAR